MFRIALVVGWVAVIAAGCSKDRESEPAGNRNAAPGVSVVPKSELGPQGDEIVEEVAVSTSSKQARAAFTRGRELFENVRHAEAAEKFSAAIELDEKFAQAHTYLGLTKEGAEGLPLLRRGFQLAETLPPAERMVTKVFLLKRKGNRDKHSAAVRKMVELAPGDFRVQMWLARDLQDTGDLDGALAALEKSTRLNAKAAEPYNSIAYLHANAGSYDEAVKAAKKYAALKPSEPNPQDSLGEILMMAGEFEAGERAFKRAVEISPQFTIAWEGVAVTRLYREDYAGAIEALERAKRGARNARARNKAVSQIAWVTLISGDVDGALAIVDAQLEADEDHGGEQAEHKVKLARSAIHAADKNYEAAMKELKPVIAALNKKKAEGAEMLGWTLIKKLAIQAEAGSPARAAKTLAVIEQLEGDIHNNFFRFGLAYARGAVALANGDHMEALAHFDEISNPLFPYGVQAMWKKAECLSGAGKTNEANALRAALRSSFRREVYHAYKLARTE